MRVSLSVEAVGMFLIGTVFFSVIIITFKGHLCSRLLEEFQFVCIIGKMEWSRI